MISYLGFLWWYWRQRPKVALPIIALYGVLLVLTLIV